MRLLNRGNSPRYSELAGSTVGPGRSTRELDSFEKAVNSVFSRARGFEVVLSEGDIRLLAGLCAKYLAGSKSLESKELDDIAGIEALRASLRDPDGTKVLAERAMAVRGAVQKARREVMRERVEKEARVMAESNFLDETGNPIPHAGLIASDKRLQGLEPKKHDGMPNDMRSILENNLAIMTSASGQPLDNGSRTVVATPGGTPVPHDPKAYQKPRTVPPGQPELP